MQKTGLQYEESVANKGKFIDHRRDSEMGSTIKQRKVWLIHVTQKSDGGKQTERYY